MLFRPKLNEDQSKLKYTIYAVILFLVSAVVSCTEIKYTVWGETADAKIVSKKNTSVSRGRFGRKQVVAVRYEWQSTTGNTCRDVVNMPSGWYAPSNGVIKIDYVPGRKGSRPHGSRNYLMLTIFGGSILVMVFFVVKTVREAYD